MILIIEDDEDTLEIYREFLEMLEFEVTVASTGADALDAVRARVPDAVLLDLTLPDADGRQLCDRLREIVAPRPLPIMALTGHTLVADERAKFDAVMRKPVDLDAVAEWLRKFDHAPATPDTAG